MFVGEDHILTKVDCSDLEKQIVEGGTKNENDNNSY